MQRISKLSGRWIQLVSLAMTLGVAGPLEAAVYTTGVQFLPGGSSTIMAWTQPNLTGFGAGILLANGTPGLLQASSYTLGISQVWFSVLPGQAITASTIADYPLFANSSTGTLGSGIMVSPLKDVLLGFRMGGGSSGDDLLRFGWVQIKRSGVSEFTLVDSAIDDSGQGIFAGTLTAVPEPSAVLLSALGIAGALVRRHRNL